MLNCAIDIDLGQNISTNISTMLNSYNNMLTQMTVLLYMSIIISCCVLKACKVTLNIDVNKF